MQAGGLLSICWCALRQNVITPHDIADMSCHSLSTLTVLERSLVNALVCPKSTQNTELLIF